MDDMIRARADLQSRLRRDDELAAWRRACDHAYAESRRTTLPMMTSKEIEKRLGWKLRTPR
jgi:hypothetical protein